MENVSIYLVKAFLESMVMQAPSSQLYSDCSEQEFKFISVEPLKAGDTIFHKCVPTGYSLAFVVAQTESSLPYTPKYHSFPVLL